jgi:tetratricopeptide (TPR) repeat protein
LTESEQLAEAYKVTAANLLQNPDDPEQLTTLFAILTARGKRTPAHLALAKRIEALAPQEHIAVFNHASALMRAVKPSEGVFKRALELTTDRDQRAITLHHIGMAHHDMGDFATALKWYELAGEDAKESAAIAKMASGDLETGLYEFEVKYHQRPRKKISDSGIPRWNGEDLKDKTVLVTHEQGFGDTLQFIRFAPQLRALGVRKLIFTGHPALHTLIKDNFKFDAVIDEEGPFKGDFVTSPMAACALLKTKYKDISGEPYMKAKPMDLPKRGKLRIGLSWKGNPDYLHDANRSMSLADLCPLFDLPGAAFYSLQLRPAPTEIGELGLDGFIGDLAPLIKDWRDTARAISAMDVIVTTDSANAHMAGALGKPTLLLLNYTPCWRWMTKRDNTPWYKSTKLFRQAKPFEWPVEAVRKELEGMLQ